MRLHRAAGPVTGPVARRAIGRTTDMRATMRTRQAAGTAAEHVARLLTGLPIHVARLAIALAVALRLTRSSHAFALDEAFANSLRQLTAARDDGALDVAHRAAARRYYEHAKERAAASAEPALVGGPAQLEYQAFAEALGGNQGHGHGNHWARSADTQSTEASAQPRRCRQSDVILRAMLPYGHSPGWTTAVTNARPLHGRSIRRRTELTTAANL